MSDYTNNKPNSRNINEDVPTNSVGNGGVNLNKPPVLGTVSRSLGLGPQHKDSGSRSAQEQKRHAVRSALAKRMKERREKNSK